MPPGINAFTEETLRRMSREERSQLHELVIDSRTQNFRGNTVYKQMKYAQSATLELLLIKVRKSFGDFENG